MRSDQQLFAAMERHADMVRRICMVHLKSEADTEDIFQEVFMKYVFSSQVFESEEHEKAWFIRVSINACKDLLKSFFRKNTVGIEEAIEPFQKDMDDERREVLEAVLELPKKYRDIIYLHYYEGYAATEIAQLLNKNVNTIYTLLARGRDSLRKTLGDEGYEE
ncbi:MAG: RNA polymerase sigma factor [Tissierellia bacterium]|jgi:RNA polymerase sigma-70 factor (ECF subfamily)|nr:RNA polymerase sigma factor [Bacillota bacterium]NLL23645.1 RNA polymerase sigma factor [Tissierellia bacterium]